MPKSHVDATRPIESVGREGGACRAQFKTEQLLKNCKLNPVPSRGRLPAPSEMS